MTPVQFARAEKLFHEAFERASNHRLAWVREQCADDPEVLRKVEGMLAQDELAHVGLDVPAAGLAFHVGDIDGTDQRVREELEATGRFQILSLLGEGGFGIVYEAEQLQPVRRRVAVKVIKPGMDTRKVIVRFAAERQTLAMMTHPNIARVLDAGATDGGRPYFVMELVEGPPIIEYCDTHGLNLRARLELFATVCHAVQHAHQKGIIHRDIKPSNVLVVNQDGKPAPRVIDFGIAQIFDDPPEGRTLMTEQGQMIGTPEYMSPEQAAGKRDIDTRTDIYSLGVLLYQMLTGSTPIDRSSLGDIGIADFQRLIREKDPPTPSTRVRTLGEKTAKVAHGRRTDSASLSRMLRGDLDWIAMKALEKDRARRYETVNSLAMDIRRYLTDEPVLARPPTAAYRFRKFARRHRAALVAGVGMAVLLLAAVAGTSVGLMRARVAEQHTRRESAIASAVNEFLNDDLLAAVSPEAQGKDVQMREVLAVAEERISARFPDQPIVESAIRLTLGKTYQSLGEYDRAQRHLERARDLLADTLDPDDLATHEATFALANLRIDQGRYDEAEALFSEALARLRAVPGSADPAPARALYGLGRIDAARGHYKTAALALEDALHRLQKTVGLRDRRTTDVMATLAAVYRNLELPDKAEAMYHKSLETSRAQLGPEHPSTLAAMNDLAVFYKSQGRYDEAVTTFEQVLAGSRRVLGAEHPDTLNAAVGTATLYYVLGRLDDAEALFLHTLDALGKSLGADHPRTLTCANSLARVYLRRKEYDEAERLCVETFETLRRRFGEENPRTITAMSTLAQIYQAQGRLAEAEPLFANLVQLQRKLLGRKHRDTITAMNNLAGLYALQKRFEEAEVLMAATVSAGREALPAGHSYLGAYLTTHGQVLRHLSRFDDAERALLEARNILVAALGPSHQRTLKATKELVELYDAWAKPEEADRWRAELTPAQPAERK